MIKPSDIINHLKVELVKHTDLFSESLDSSFFGASFLDFEEPFFVGFFFDMIGDSSERFNE